MNYVVVDKIERKGYPTTSKDYPPAHTATTREERRIFPRRDYNRLKKLGQQIPKNELLGTHDPRIKVSRRVPRDLRNEVAWHEGNEELQMKKGRYRRGKRP